MRTRTPWLLLVLAALVLGSVGSLVAVAATPRTAVACSIAGPYAEVRPSTGLHPGQHIDIVGWSFLDIRLHEPQPAAIAPPNSDPDSDIAVLPPLCDFDTFPLEAMRVVWRGPSRSGEISTTLGVVSGPDFKLSATVPENAGEGRATIIIGPVTVDIRVGQVVEPPPPPCPLMADGRTAVSQDCPDPWPCPLYGADASSSQPAPDHAPGFLPYCPEPCVDFAHTTDAGPEYGYRWDCPDPCGSAANPGAARPEAAVRCPPPPDPCPLYLAAVPETSSKAQAWCPDPCPVYLDGDAVASPDAQRACPDPCGLVGGDAVWCPPPPDPCEVYFEGHATVAPGGSPDELNDELVACPDPCGYRPEVPVWCVPPCFENVDAAAIACPRPVPVPVPPASEPAPGPAGEPTTTELGLFAPSAPAANTQSAVQPAISFGEDEALRTGAVSAPAISAGAVAASTAVTDMARAIVAIAQGLLASLFG